jgi:hypothetical protein
MEETMAKQGVVVVKITERQIVCLRSCASDMGYADASRRSRKRLRAVLRMVTDQATYDKVMNLLHDVSAPAYTKSQLCDEQAKFLARSVTEWGAFHFDKLLNLVGLLRPGREHVGRIFFSLSKLSRVGDDGRSC